MRFQPPVQFPVFVEGKRMKALVLEETDHIEQTIFRVRFSDGFEDEFELEDDGQVYGSGIASIPYAKAIRIDLNQVLGLDPGRFFYIYQEMIDGIKANIWVVEGDSEENEIIYKVYYNEFFRFALKKENNNWIVSHKPAFGRQPDEGIVRKTGLLLNSVLEEWR